MNLIWWWVETRTVDSPRGRPYALTLTPFRAPAFWPLAVLVGGVVGRRAHRRGTSRPLFRITLEREETK